MKSFNSVLFTLLFIFFSCKNDDENQCHEVLEYTTLEAEYNCSNTIFDLNVDWDSVGNNSVLIRNQDQFNYLVSGTCTPDIDFAQYDLFLVLILIQESGVNSYTASVIQTCQNDISIKLTIDEIEGNWENSVGVFHLLIPKLEENQNITQVNWEFI